MAGHIIVLTTVASQEDGIKLARELVSRRLAACVNITGPIQSVYRWKGEVHEETERLLLIKTVADDFNRLRDTIVKLHTYELPEVVALSIENGFEAYLNWITAGSSSEALELP